MICSLMNYFANNLDPNEFIEEIESLKKWITKFNALILEHINSTELYDHNLAKSNT